jgi:hypothetical protein
VPTAANACDHLDAAEILGLDHAPNSRTRSWKIQTDGNARGRLNERGRQRIADLGGGWRTAMLNQEFVDGPVVWLDEEPQSKRWSLFFGKGPPATSSQTRLVFQKGEIDVSLNNVAIAT